MVLYFRKGLNRSFAYGFKLLYVLILVQRIAAHYIEHSINAFTNKITIMLEISFPQHMVHVAILIVYSSSIYYILIYYVY